MSANVSLGDAGPGLSAYFDGQPIHDQQEAELRQEEARQDCEVRKDDDTSWLDNKVNMQFEIEARKYTFTCTTSVVLSFF